MGGEIPPWIPGGRWDPRLDPRWERRDPANGGGIPAIPPGIPGGIGGIPPESRLPFYLGYFALIEVVSFSLNSLLFSSPSISGHLKMDDHEKTINQGLNLSVSRFNFLLSLSRCVDTV